MAHIVDTTEYLDMVCGLLREGHTHVPVPVKGVSMRPFLRDGDLVYLDPIREPPKPGDIVLFLRSNGQYILHRIYRRTPKGYLMLGDSQSRLEPISPEQLRARVVCVRCGDREIGPGDLRWWLFEKPWRWFAPHRPLIGKIYRRIRGKNKNPS